MLWYCIMPIESVTGSPDPYARLREFAEFVPPIWRGSTQSVIDEAVHNGTPGFRSIVAPAGIVHTLSAIAEEPTPWVRESLDQIRTQRTIRPFATILSANGTSAALQTERARDNLAEIQAYQRDYPRFPLGYFVQEYPVDTAISTVRADLKRVGVGWYGQQAESHGFSVRDIMLLTWDWDTRVADPSYLQKIDEVRQNSRANYVMAYPHTQHDRLDGDFPRANRLLDLYDKTFGRSPGHMAINLEGYVASGGFPYGVAVNENYWIAAILKGCVKAEPLSYEATTVQAKVIMSSRNLVSRIFSGQDIGYGEIQVLDAGMTSHREPFIPKKDISAAEYRTRLHLRLYNIAHDILPHALELADQALSKESQREQAFDITTQVVMRALKDVGGNQDRRSVRIAKQAINTLRKNDQKGVLHFDTT